MREWRWLESRCLKRPYCHHVRPSIDGQMVFLDISTLATFSTIYRIPFLSQAFSNSAEFVFMFRQNQKELFPYPGFIILYSMLFYSRVVPQAYLPWLRLFSYLVTDIDLVGMRRGISRGSYLFQYWQEFIVKWSFLQTWVQLELCCGIFSLFLNHIVKTILLKCEYSFYCCNCQTQLSWVLAI